MFPPGSVDCAPMVGRSTARQPFLAYFERRIDGPDAADLLSETMLTAWRRIDDLPQDDVEARMWLFEDLRDLVGLVHWEGATLAEAAGIVGIPASTARGRYQAARRRLADMLAPALSDSGAHGGEDA